MQRARAPVKALVAVAHGDDEVIGPGGTLIRAKRELPSLKITAVLFTTSFDPRLAKIREREFRESCRRLQAEPVILGLGSWGGEDENGVRFLEPKQADFDTVRKLVSQESPSCIFAHSPDDAHPDHRAVNALVRNALPFRRPVRVILTQTWNTLTSPNLLVGFGLDVLHEKQWVLGAHSSQITRNRFLDLVESTDQRNAVLGPELVRGFGTPGITSPCAEVFLALDVNHGVPERIEHGRLPKGRKDWVFTHEDPLTESIFSCASGSKSR